jgi:hypothetical protein
MWGEGGRVSGIIFGSKVTRRKSISWKQRGIKRRSRGCGTTSVLVRLPQRVWLGPGPREWPLLGGAISRSAPKLARRMQKMSMLVRLSMSQPFHPAPGKAPSPAGSRDVSGGMAHRPPASTCKQDPPSTTTPIDCRTFAAFHLGLLGHSGFRCFGGWGVDVY